MKTWIVLLALLASAPAQAVELSRLAIQYDRFLGKTFMPEMPSWEAKEGLAVLFDVDLGARFFWKNRVHALTDPGQYRLVGWQFELGWAPTSWLSLAYHHHSQHILDARHPDFKFAGVENSAEAVWTIYTK